MKFNCEGQNLKDGLEKYKEQIEHNNTGGKVDLSYTDLHNADLSHVHLSGANLRNADLRGANLIYKDLHNADLSHARLTGANLSYVNLRDADLRDANLYNANLSGTELAGADLAGADLRNANLRGANLSGAKNVLSQIEFIQNNFESTNDGVIVYKTFGNVFEIPEEWEIQEGSIIFENVNFDRALFRGCGINVAPLKWVEKSGDEFKDIWKCLIRWEWLSGVCVPYNTDGEIRCEKLELLEKVKQISS